LLGELDGCRRERGEDRSNEQCCSHRWFHSLVGPWPAGKSAAAGGRVC